MDLKNLLAKLDVLEGSMQRAVKHSTGPEFTGYWKGTDAGTPGKKMVGGSEQQESILKDLSKGPRAKTREQELAEQYAAYLQALEEESLGVNPKRPAREGSRPAREYTKDGEKSKRYNYQTTDVEEGAMKDLHTELADKYRELAPKIERHRDSYLAGELYDALEEIAARHGAIAEFNRIMNRARNSAHMDYDTNPGGFQNWFWYLPFADEQDLEEGSQRISKHEPYWVCVDGKKWKRFETYAHARSVHDKLEKKFRKEGKDKRVSLLADLDEDLNDEYVDVPKSQSHDLIAVFRKELEDLHDSDRTPAEKQAIYSYLVDKFAKEVDEYKSQQIDEFVATNPPQGTQNQTIGQQQSQAQPTDQAKAAAQATQTIKSVTQSSAPAPKLAQSIATATTGQAVNPTDMKALQPLMKDVATIAQDPKLANQFKTLASQANQAQKKQQAQLQQQAQQGGAE